MIIAVCSYCGKKYQRKTKPTTKYNYCTVSCQMNNEYKLGIRDKKKIVKKAQKAAQKRQKKDNWLNYKSSRDKLREAMNTTAYKLKAGLSKLGELNPMYGKKGKEGGHWKGGSKRKYGNASRGIGWKSIKYDIKNRDNHKCRICGRTAEEVGTYLQVHHIVPYKCEEDNSNDNLITVCPKCHTKIEPIFVKIRNIKKVQSNENVYNLSVKDDETYYANNALVHNCRTVVRLIEAEDVR